MPTFTAADVRNAIPKHCFERSLLWSFAYIFHDIIIMLTLFKAATYIDYLPAWVGYILWPTYWLVQGCFGFGLWVLAHECGHFAFSDYRTLNDIVGLICHSILLVPYHSWRITHKNYHGNTGSIENDEAFVPFKRSELLKEMVQESPLYIIYQFVLIFTLGWLPGYLCYHIGGPVKYKRKSKSHFNPHAALFEPEDYWYIVISDIGIFIVASLLGLSIYHYGFRAFFFYYFLPLLITNNSLILVTYLQHTDVYMPHFDKTEWTWLRGALCTVDRDFGVLNYVWHHITGTHVCHHLFHTIPFYNAKEATVAIKKVLGKYHLRDDTPVL
jgi:omega-6 fatty acid desaturase (delta-12 desaturase)